MAAYDRTCDQELINFKISKNELNTLQNNLWAAQTLLSLNNRLLMYTEYNSRETLDVLESIIYDTRRILCESADA